MATTATPPQFAPHDRTTGTNAQTTAADTDLRHKEAVHDRPAAHAGHDASATSSTTGRTDQHTTVPDTVQIATGVTAATLKTVEFGVDDPLVPEKSAPPFLLPQSFKPQELLGGDPAAWLTVLRGLSPKLPVQLHCEPFNIADTELPNCQPIFRNAVRLLNAIPELEELMRPTKPSGEQRRARLKFRLATSGKFIHRNRFRRRQILCCLYGEQTWLFMSAYGGAADKFLSRSTNDNWNGFRSMAHPTMLSVEEMHRLAATAPEGVVAKVVKFRAGDVMEFDGRWWHATSYTSPVLNLFFTPGDDMEVAVKEHKRRMAMPMQKDLALCKVTMAKCSKLAAGGAGAWTKTVDGRDINWKADGHIPLPEGPNGAQEQEEEDY